MTSISTASVSSTSIDRDACRRTLPVVVDIDLEESMANDISNFTQRRAVSLRQLGVLFWADCGVLATLPDIHSEKKRITSGVELVCQCSNSLSKLRIPM